MLKHFVIGHWFTNCVSLTKGK